MEGIRASVREIWVIEYVCKSESDEYVGES